MHSGTYMCIYSKLPEMRTLLYLNMPKTVLYNTNSPLKCGLPLQSGQFNWTQWHPEKGGSTMHVFINSLKLALVIRYLDTHGS